MEAHRCFADPHAGALGCVVLGDTHYQALAGMQSPWRGRPHLRHCHLAVYHAFYEFLQVLLHVSLFNKDNTVFQTAGFMSYVWSFKANFWCGCITFSFVFMLLEGETF